MQRRFAVLAVGLGLWAFLACEASDGNGTGPGNGGGPGTGTQIRSTPNLDGWARSDGQIGTTGAAAAGDLDAIGQGLGVRMFYSFDISSFSSVTSATLRIYQTGVINTPYTDLGNLIVDHVDYGAALDLGDYQVAALANAGTLSTDATVEYKTLDVTARVQADRAAGRTRSQFRLRFSNRDSNSDSGTDVASFTDGETQSINFPMLVVK